MSVQSDIDQLKIDVAELTELIGEMETSAQSTSEYIGKTDNVFKDITKSLGKIVKDQKTFLGSIKAQYLMAEKFAQEYKKVGVNIGMAVGRQAEFGDVFIESAALVRRFGGDMNDVAEAYGDFIAQSGRARILNPEEVKDMVMLSKATGMVGGKAYELMERFDLMGVSAKQSNEAIAEIFVSSQKLGLNASKVANTLADNFVSMQHYSFRDGVKGMTKMAQLAVKMRMDVSEMLSMADKFYQPEAAIEAAANLQMLGGDIAREFGNPFELMYLARNQPEELAEKVRKMTENMIQFNKETGQYEFPPEVRMQLQATGEQLLGNRDALIDVARQSAKIKDIKMDVSGSIMDPSTREGIASLARMNDKKEWVVDFQGAETKIDEIGPELAKKILSAPKTEKDAILDTAMAARTTNQYLSDISETLKYKVIKTANFYQGVEQGLRPPGDKGAAEVIFDAVSTAQTNMLDVYQNQLGNLLEEDVANVGAYGGHLAQEFVDEIGKMNILSGLRDEEVETMINLGKGYNQKGNKNVTGTGNPNVTGMGVKEYMVDGKVVKHSGDININGKITVDAGSILADSGVDFKTLEEPIKKLILKYIDQTLWKGGVPSSADFLNIIATGKYP